MPTSQGMAHGLRVALLALVMIAPGALLAARILRPGVSAPVRFDIDGQGAVERVDLVRHGEDRWLDASVADAGGWRLVSSTRVPGTDGTKWSMAVEVVAPGNVRLHVRDGGGRLTSWRRDGLAFAPEHARP
jgi:hypothetical protein